MSDNRSEHTDYTHKELMYMIILGLTVVPILFTYRLVLVTGMLSMCLLVIIVSYPLMWIDSLGRQIYDWIKLL